MSLVFSERVRTLFAPPEYLAQPLSGFDLSTNGVKAVRLAESADGLVLTRYAQTRLPAGVFIDGEVVDSVAVVEALKATAKAIGVSSANVALPESKSYLFEMVASGANKDEWRTAVEQHLDEFIPLPLPETTFDFVTDGEANGGEVAIAGIGFATRIVDSTLSIFDAAGVSVQSLEGEAFALVRALLPPNDNSTVLIIDMGDTTTKLSIVAARIPRFTTTINIGGHALTLAVQKYFGVTEDEARKVKAEHGIVPMPGNEEYLAAMLLTVSVIRDEIARRLVYWQERAAPNGPHQLVSRVFLVGGNSFIKGLPEYFEGSLNIPVVLGDVFTNCAPREVWIPNIDRNDSFAYGTAIGLALRNYTEYAS